ncbi:MAG: UDP-N-acetylmuramoyl-tripeptide--D-alanyl-D-alanine ligase [Lachnospiraceae bacterium]|nr:UDP-N-acetylmuramoyl-tripeptide--D-alanyl-D-alanine ligase [Lachnospiraceae bacterium]
MKNLTLEHIAAACHGTYVGAEHEKSMCVSDITTDSRKNTDGCLFVPIKGARVDGHDYIPQVIADGALAVLSENDLGKQEFPYIRIKSSLQAVKDIAEYYLQQVHIPVVGITGSVGKTSTKEVIAAVLAQKYQVLKTQGNFNNELGLPLTVFRIREDDEIAVLEMGISDFGEMSRLARIARPETAVITNIGWCHLENLRDRDGIFRAKTEIFDYLKPQGNVILNGDDDKLNQVTEVQGKSPMLFGISHNNDVYATDMVSLGLKGVTCRIHTPGGSFDTLIPMPGQHMVYNALAGTCVGLTYGLSLQQIKAGIESLQPVSGRFHIIENEKYTIVDDCYNANPVSMKASIAVLGDALGRKVAVLGDMGELGADEAALHAEVGTYAGEQKLDALYCVGPLCRHMAEAAKKACPSMEVQHFDTRDLLIRQLPSLLKKGDTILIKASHFMQFERIIEIL